MLAEIPPPPPHNTVLMAAAACVLVGVALLLWGRSLGRVLLTMIAGGTAAACARLIALYSPAEVISNNIWVIGLGAALIVGFLAYVLSRLIWAVALGVLLGAAALGVVAWLNAGAIVDKPVWDDHQLAGFAGWCVCLSDYLSRWALSLWEHNATIATVAGCGPLLAAIAVGIFLPRTAVILTSSFIGAASVVGGVALSVWARQPAWMTAWFKHAYIPIAAAGVLAVVGLFIQTGGELASAAQAAEPDERPAQAGQNGATWPAQKLEQDRGK